MLADGEELVFVGTREEAAHRLEEGTLDMSDGRLVKVREKFAGLSHKPHETGCSGRRAINRSGLPGFPRTVRAATR